MKIGFEYGHGLMEADLPENTDVFIPGETVPDPPYIEDVVEETRKAILNPIGMPPLAKAFKKGIRLSLCFQIR